MNDRPILFKIGFAPADPDSREALELILAAAALELRTNVIFTGPGRAHLDPEHAPPWRQLVDHGLAGVFYLDCARPTGRPAAQFAATGLDAPGLARLESASAQVLVL